MDKDIRRKTQVWKSSYTVTIPLNMVHRLGIEKDQYLRFVLVGDAIIIKPSDSKVTKKEMAEAGRIADQMRERPSYMDDFEAAIRKNGEIAKRRDEEERRRANSRSRLEKLRMK